MRDKCFSSARRMAYVETSGGGENDVKKAPQIRWFLENIKYDAKSTSKIRRIARFLISDVKAPSKIRRFLRIQKNDEFCPQTSVSAN